MDVVLDQALLCSCFVIIPFNSFAASAGFSALSGAVATFSAKVILPFMANFPFAKGLAFMFFNLLVPLIFFLSCWAKNLVETKIGSAPTHWIEVWT